MKAKTKRKLVRLRRAMCYVLVTVLIVAVCGYLAGLILFRGPSPKLNSIVKYTLLETRRFSSIPYLFLSEEEVGQAEFTALRNSDNGVYARTNTDLFTTPEPQPEQPAAAEQPDEPQAEEPVDTSPKPDAYGLLDEDGDGVVLQKLNYKGSAVYIMVVYDPSRVFVGTAVQDPEQKYGYGITLESMIDTYDAIGGINAGGFIDDGGTGSGWPPYGITYASGACYNSNMAGPIAAFDKDNILHVGYYDYNDCELSEFRDAVSFGPLLIVNDEKVDPSMLPSGIGPRTCIGQRQDKAVVLMAVDGRQAYSIGITYADCADILHDKYGCVNATNMDGGNSTCMAFNGEMINNPSNVAGGTRDLPTAWLVRK